MKSLNIHRLSPLSQWIVSSVDDMVLGSFGDRRLDCAGLADVLDDGDAFDELYDTHKEVAEDNDQAIATRSEFGNAADDAAKYLRDAQKIIEGMLDDKYYEVVRGIEKYEVVELFCSDILRQGGELTECLQALIGAVCEDKDLDEVFERFLWQAIERLGAREIFAEHEDAEERAEEMSEE